MVPILLNRNEINDAAWNRLVEKSTQSIIYAFTFYLDLVCADWKALVWSSAGEYETIMPLPVRRKWGFEIIYQPHFCQYLGVFSQRPVTAEEITAFLAQLNKHYRYISAYHFNPDNHEVLRSQLSQIAGIEVEEQETHWLPLDQQYEKIANGYSRDRVRNLKRSEKSRWRYSVSNHIHPLIFLFVNHHARRIPGGVSHASYQTLEALFKSLSRMQCCDLWYAHRDGVIHAGILMIRFRGKAVFLFNAADEIGRKDNARTFLLDSYIKLHAESDLIFDFESPMKSSIASFYKSFGSTTVPFWKISKNRLPFPLRQIQHWRKRNKLRTR
ncbi:hypothetical protein DYBT9623_04001 [Dyadobacter sp. CECT 9623]|uniref:BioF2-like acetyltransferase domain-containing protein n=1 Tax=Dyadobacter linearis TaxID=2823330 RepID=A0ABM8UUR2_9BACT|nr:GNAT family N-acetyltransferase [Dyadobacter sp. CECT 9623]CAG5072063.1 hypothetical protein DYBT9623_04001 [Dyadobacter sp. CECT 9623]